MPIIKRELDELIKNSKSYKMTQKGKETQNQNHNSQNPAEEDTEQPKQENP